MSLAEKVAHTPGPWESEGSVVFGNNGRGLIAKAYVPSSNPSRDESNANARLIAAAPELLEALKDIVKLAELEEWYTATTGRQILFQAAEAAIRKAEGQ